MMQQQGIKAMDQVFYPATFPMGPHLKNWLCFDGQEFLSKKESEKFKEDFAHFLQDKIAANPIKDSLQLTDLVDELLAMDFPYEVLQLIDKNIALWSERDFRGQNAEGIAAMLCAEFTRAKDCFFKAHELMPKEPGPYVNIAQILQNEGQWTRAHDWCVAGLVYEKNHFPLWDLLASYFFREDNANALVSLREFVLKQDSWAGSLLLSSLDNQADPSIRMDALKPFYDRGERSKEFLIEYTAALGMALHYDKIPPIVWQAEKIHSDGLPWKLYAHLLQALLGMEKKEEFIQVAKKMFSRNIFPDAQQREIKELIKELESEAQSTLH